MSLQNRFQQGKSVEWTYETLAQSADDLQKQVDRTKLAADEVDKTPDLRKYNRLQKTHQESKAQLQKYRDVLEELRIKLGTHSLLNQILQTLGAISNEINALDRRLPLIDQQHQSLMNTNNNNNNNNRIPQSNSRMPPQSSAANEEPEEAPGMQQAREDALELEYIHRETEQIVQTVNAINDVSHQIDNKVTEDHEKIVKIDDSIEGANVSMVKGNEQLDKAEDHQKCSKKCLIFILIIILAVVVVIAIIIGCTVGLKKKDKGQ